MPYVYILRCRDGSLYTGAAVDVERRLAQHGVGAASSYTRARRPVTLAWVRRVRTWERALRLEWLIKQLARAEKLALVAGKRRAPAVRARPVSAARARRAGAMRRNATARAGGKPPGGVA